MLEMFKIKIDHNILLRRSGLRRTGKKMTGCSIERSSRNQRGLTTRYAREHRGHRKKLFTSGLVPVETMIGLKARNNLA